MAFVIRIFISLIVFCGFGFLVYVSFFYSQNSLQQTDISFLQEEKTSAGDIQSFHASKFESLYSEVGGEKQASEFFSGDNTVVEVKTTGQYLSSLRDVRKEYQFEGEGFSFSQEGPGEIYYTLDDNGEVFIFSFNAIVKVNLHGTEKKDKYTSIYLYPHTYITLNPKRGKFLKNADRVRIETVYDLGFIQHISDLFESENKNIKKRLTSNDFLKNALLAHRELKENSRSILSIIEGSYIPPLPGEGLIEKYNELFVNEEKKQIYYKNRALSSLLDVVFSESVDDELLGEHQKHMLELKDFHNESYLQVQKLSQDIFAHVFMAGEKQFIIPKKALAQVELLGDTKKDELDFFPLYSYSLFDSYNASQVFNVQLLGKYFESFNSWSQQDLLSQEYFLYFLEQQILSEVGGEYDEGSFKYVNSVLEKYLIISSELYKNSDSTKATALFVYGNILQDLSVYVRENFFKESRAQTNVLSLHESNRILAIELGKLKNSISTLTAFFSSNSGILNLKQGRDVAIKNNFLKSEEQLSEYILALESYEAYVNKYDTGKKDLLSFDVTGGTTKKNTITREEFDTYMKGFVGVTLNGNEEVEIVSGVYYKVSNLLISGRSLDFQLFPLSSNKIRNIVVNGEKKNSEYKLDLVQEDWEERRRSAPPEDKDLFDFSRFFIITFFSTQQREVDIIEDDVVKVSEDKTEIVFKRSKLLGEGAELGEFESLSNFLDIEYNDITLDRTGNTYKVGLKDVVFTIALKEDNKMYSGVLEATYDLASSSRSFLNTELLVYRDPRDSKRGYMLGGAKIKIWKAKKDEYFESIDQIFEDFTTINLVYSSVQVVGPSDITIDYFPFNKTYSLKFSDADGQKYTVNFDRNQNISTLLMGTKKVSNISVEDLESTLNK